MTKAEKIQLLEVEFRLTPERLVMEEPNHMVWCGIKDEDRRYFCTRYPGHKGLHLACWLRGERFSRCPVEPWE